MKTPKLKPRRMWANYYEGANDGIPFLHSTRAAAQKCNSSGVDTVPVAVIPLDDVEELVERASVALSIERGYSWAYAPKFQLSARAALAAIGVLPSPSKTAKSRRPRFPVEFENSEMGDEG